MARLFAAASSQYIELGTGVLTAAPLTLAAWFRGTDTANSQDVVSLAASANTSNYFALNLGGNVAGDPIRAITSAGVASSAVTTTGYVASTWHHGCAVFAAANSRAAYIDGGSKGTETTSRAPAGVDRSAVGRRSASTPAAYYSGRIVEVAIWDEALSDYEVEQIAKGLHPTEVRPWALRVYLPIWGLQSPEVDYIDPTRQWVVSGPVPIEHVTVAPTYPGRPMVGPGAKFPGLGRR